MVFVFYLKFVRLRDQLTVETRRNLDPCQIDNFVSGLILSLLTDCRLCPAPGPPPASAAIPALREINITNKPTHRELSRFKEIKIIHQTHNYNSCKSFSCQSLRIVDRRWSQPHSLKLAQAHHKWTTVMLISTPSSIHLRAAVSGADLLWAALLAFIVNIVNSH